MPRSFPSQSWEPAVPACIPTFPYLKNGRNTFCDSVKYACEISAVTNPIVNSYKRLVPGHEAPIHAAWSAKNRSTMIRSPDSTGNHYLALALILNAGLEGIKNKLQPSAPYEKNVYGISEEERVGIGIGIAKLPESLMEAIDCMKGSEMVKEVLGEHVFEKYIEAKTLEWNNYREVVTQWEFDQYIGKY